MCLNNIFKRKVVLLNNGKKIRVSKRIFDVIEGKVNQFTQEGMIIIREKDDYKSPIIFIVRYGDISAIY